MFGVRGIELRRQRGLKQSRRNRAQLGCGTLDAPARFPPAHYREPPARTAFPLAVFSVDQRFAAQWSSYVEVPADFHAGEIRGRHTHYAKSVPVDGEGAVQHETLSAKFALPEGIADGNSGLAAFWLIVCWTEQAPERRLHS